MTINAIWLIMIAVMVLSFIVQQGLTHRFDKYSQVQLRSGLTGAQVAEQMLRDHGITDVKVERATGGKLSDHYNPQTKTLNLSDAVYGCSSVAAAAVAAHECGHAVQHATGYAPLKMRSSLVPAVSFASSWVQWILLAGVLFINVFPHLIWIGIGLFAITTLFSLVTLPVETNASARAIEWLDHSRLVDYDQVPMASTALRWAAYTYFIAAIGSLATLFYYILLASDRRR